jgi:ornithine carbamoyltransferase
VSTVKAGTGADIYDFDVNEPRHFITGTELRREELLALIHRARELKSAADGSARPLADKSVAIFLARPSTRTRASFEVGISELGGTPVVLRSDELQLTRGESPRDTALVLSRYVDAIVARPGSDETIDEMARYAEVPVVNALTPLHHPCQALADLMTLEERFGALDGLRLAYVGDGNNVCHSLMLQGSAVGVEVVAATPPDLRPAESIVRQAGERVSVTDDPRAAVAGAHAIYVDVWVSMGDEAEAARRRRLLAPFRLDDDLLSHARDDAVAMHCLPAHPGEEITEGVLYGARSAVWDQAENRLHSQKALLEFLLG